MHAMLHTLAVLLLFVATLLGQSPVLVENAGTLPQSAWVYCALPVEDLPSNRVGLIKSEHGVYTFVRDRAGIRIKIESLPVGIHKLHFSSDESKIEPFKYHPALDLQKLLPRWWYAGRLSDYPYYWALGSQKPADSFARVVEADECRQVWHVRQQHKAERLTHDLWATIYSGQLEVEFSTVTTYGTTANDGQSPEINLGPLYLIDRTEKHADFRNLTSLPQNAQNPDTTWALPLHAAPTKLLRGRRIITHGAWNSTAARRQGPLVAVYSGWDGKWFAGSLPEVPLGAADEMKQARERFFATGQRGTYWDPRPYVQPPWSQTTGDQPGFGANVLGQALTMGAPWRVRDLLFSCDSYAIRPTAYREPSGDPMRAALHPLAETIEGGYDARFGQGDRLGWPAQAIWIDGYTPSDAQHRDARTLHSVYRLTDDRALLSIIEDQTEIARLDYRLKHGLVDAARAHGRVLLDYAGALWCGVDTQPLITRTLDIMAAEVARRGEKEIFWPAAIDLAKYGWPVGDGVQPWQMSILATQGLDSVWKLTGDKRAREWSLRLARQVVDLAFFPRGTSDYAHVYAIAWVDGTKPPPEKLDGQTNDRVFIEPATDWWDIAACELVAHDEPDTDLGRKAKALLAWRGQARSWAEAQWRAVR